LFESSFSAANINEVDNRIMTVPTVETPVMVFGVSQAAGTYVKNNLRFAAIVNKDNTNYIRLRLKKLFLNRIATVGGITAGANYPNGSYTNVPLTGGTGTGATANITVAGSGLYTLGAITPGSLYTNGTYSSVALTGGSGTGATALIIVAGGVVVDVVITTRGTGYTVGNVLSALAANIGGTGSGFSIPVTALAGGVSTAALVEYGSGYTAADSLSFANTNTGNSGSGFVLPVATTESVSDIFDHKLEAGKPFVICNPTISTSKVNGSFTAFNDIESISAQANTDPVDIEIYVASI